MAKIAALAGSPGWRRAGVCLLTLGAFATAIPNGFLWIDHWQIESGGLIADSPSTLWAALFRPLGAMENWDNIPYTRPTVVVVLSALNYAAGHFAPAYHLLLVILHVANAYLGLAFLEGMGLPASVAWLAASVFALHPLQTAAVSWVSGIADPLAALLVLLTLHCELHTRPDSQRPGAWLRWRLGGVLCAVLALGAKESAVVLPLLVALAVLFPTGKDGTNSVTSHHAPSAGLALRSAVSAVSTYLGVVGCFLLYRHLVLRASAFGMTNAAFPFAARLWTAPRLVVDYLLLPLRVGRLTICDDFLVSPSFGAAEFCAAVVVAGLLATVAVSWTRSRAVGFGVTWMLIALLPVLNLIPILHYRADRFFYLPLLGWSVAAAALLRAVLQRLRVGASGFAMLAVLAPLVLGGMTAHRNRFFHDDLSLFEETVRISPHCREARTALGDTYLRLTRLEEAAAQYRLALVSDANRASYVVLAKVLINLGLTHLAQHQYTEAIEVMSRAHDRAPQLIQPLFGLGVANLALGHFTEAARWLEQAASIRKDDPDIVLNLAQAYDGGNRPAEAASEYRRYLDLAPNGRAATPVRKRLGEMTR